MNVSIRFADGQHASIQAASFRREGGKIFIAIDSACVTRVEMSGEMEECKSPPPATEAELAGIVKGLIEKLPHLFNAQ